MPISASPPGPAARPCRPPAARSRLAARGRELQRHFAGGLHRLVLRWPAAGGPGRNRRSTTARR
ncbi:hypothetical protein PEC18_37760 [Paucibacter sp. O1-1]|nr:hypothetical protein [Paucibacter sp. O1-1]MDA3831381.1 hypothetical protein [Paucibacter sp. O1-1]